jgi:hypothetical protein
MKGLGACERNLFRAARNNMGESLEDKEFDIALSFAGEDRALVEEIANQLKAARVRVFYDNFHKASLWGKDLYQHLQAIYRDKAKYCIVFVSKSYLQKSLRKGASAARRGQGLRFPSPRPTRHADSWRAFRQSSCQAHGGRERFIEGPAARRVSRRRRPSKRSAHRAHHVGRPVIARSPCDEAIQGRRHVRHQGAADAVLWPLD